MFPLSLPICRLLDNPTNNMPRWFLWN